MAKIQILSPMLQFHTAEGHIEVISWLNAAILNNHQMNLLPFCPQGQTGMFLMHTQVWDSLGLA